MNKLKTFLSRDTTGLIIAIIGVFIQGFHTFFVALQTSSIQHTIFTPIYALLVSIFVSSGLLFFSLRAGSTKNELDRIKYQEISNNFRWFETFINLYYVLRRLIYLPLTVDNKEWLQLNYFDIVIGVAFSFALPYILSLYSGQIKLESKELIKGEELNVKLIEGNKKEGRFRFRIL